MHSESEQYVDSLNKFWHKLFEISNYNTLQNQFEELKGLTTHEIEIINLVYNKSDIILREICNSLNIPKSSMTSMIDRLEKKNYVKRIISKRDRRSFGIQLTDKGKILHEKYEKCENIILKKIINALDTENEKQTFLKLINKITNNIEA